MPFTFRNPAPESAAGKLGWSPKEEEACLGVSAGERGVGWCRDLVGTQPPLGRSCFEVHRLCSREVPPPVLLVSNSASRYKVLFQRNRLSFLKYLPASLEG